MHLQRGMILSYLWLKKEYLTYSYLSFQTNVLLMLFLIIFHFVNRTTLEKKLPLLRKLKNKNYSFYFASHCVKNDRIWSYSGPHISTLRLNTGIQPECGKMRPRITPNADTFYAVSFCYLNRYGEMWLSIHVYWSC